MNGQITDLTTPEEYRRFFELSMDLFVIIDANGVIRTVNPVWERVLGFRADELVGRPFMAFIHPDDLQKTADAFSRAMNVLSFGDFENRYRVKGGGYRTLRWNTTSQGSMIYAVARDVTEDEDARQKLEEANRRMANALQLERDARAMTEVQQERFRDFFAQAPMIAVVFSGEEQLIELANPSFYTLVNYRNLMGRPVREAIRLDDQTSRILTTVYETGNRFVGRNFAIRADWAETGKVLEKLFHCIFEPIRGRDGKVEVIWCLLFDVTENAEMEAKLRSAERMASLGEMAAGVAHEINNPLGYSLMSLEMLQKQLSEHFQGGKLPRDMNEILSRATEGMERVQNIVRGLKSFTRNDESRLEPVDLIAPLTAAVNFTSNETRHRATVKTDFRDAPKTLANEGRLTQVFINLIVNSAQAIEPGHANDHRIDVRLMSDVSGNAVVEVEDSGCGIPTEQLERIFEPFFTSKPIGIGTGLGLSIVHGIITGFGGEIQVQSSVGKGTLVRVVLPPSRTQTRTVGTVRTIEPSKKAEVEGLEMTSTKKKILIVDDDRSLRDVIVSALEDEHEVYSVESAVEALAKIGNQPLAYDWIVCDVMMPQMTGMEFYERMKARGDSSEQKIILMTGGAFTPAVRSWMEALTNPKLEKPFRIRQLKELLAKLN